MKLLTNELQKSYQNSKIYHICTEKLIFVKVNMLKGKHIIKSETIIIIQGNIEVHHVAYVI